MRWPVGEGSPYGNCLELGLLIALSGLLVISALPLAAWMMPLPNRKPVIISVSCLGVRMVKVSALLVRQAAKKLVQDDLDRIFNCEMIRFGSRRSCTSHTLLNDCDAGPGR